MRPEDLKEHLPANARILIIKLRSIGDVIYNTAVYTPLKKTWPDAHLTVMVEPAAYDLVRDHPDVDEVFCFKKGTWLEQAGSYARLLARRYDLVVDMHGGPRAALMSYITRSRFRAGSDRGRRAFLYNLPLSLDGYTLQYPLDYQAAIISRLGVEFTEKAAPAIHISQASRDRAGEILRGLGVGPGTPYMILHPGARAFDQWPAENFAAVADEVHRQYGYRVLFTCGPGQEKQVESVRSRVREARTAYFSSGLQEIAVITENARLVVCHNGGYMHLAAVVGAPVVALFGGANPRIWGPPLGRTAILYKDLPCHPCSFGSMRPECRATAAECKSEITVEDVLAAAEKLLAARGAGELA